MEISTQSDVKNLVAVKSNKLINASYKMSALEQKLLLMAVAQIEESDCEFKQCIISINDFKGILDNKNDNPYTQIKKVTRKLMERVLYAEDENGNWKLRHIVDKADYLANEGILLVTLEDDLKPLLLDLKRNFTYVDIKYALGLNSAYSIRIYEMLKRFYNPKDEYGYWTIKIDKLRYLLQVEDIYKQYRDFKRRVILQSQKEIREHTDICFDFKEIKQGRRVEELIFYIYSTKKEKQVLNFSQGTNNWAGSLNKEHQEVFDSLQDLGLSQSKATHYVQTQELDLLKESIKTTQDMITSDKITHSAGQFLCSIIDRGVITGQTEFEKKKIKSLQEKQEERKRSIRSKREGKKLHLEFDKIEQDKITSISSQATEQEQKEVLARVSGMERRMMLDDNGKVKLTSPFFYLRYKEYKGIKSYTDEDFTAWAKEEKNIKIQRYKLSDKEYMILSNEGINQEGWEIVT